MLKKNQTEKHAVKETGDEPNSSAEQHRDRGQDIIDQDTIELSTASEQKQDQQSLDPQPDSHSESSQVSGVESENSQQPSASSPERLTGDENIPLLLLLLFPAGLRHSIAAIPQRIRFKLISFFGICSMVAPLALWIAPSMKVWLSILAGSLLSILFCWALVWFGPEDHY